MKSFSQTDVLSLSELSTSDGRSGERVRAYHDLLRFQAYLPTYLPTTFLLCHAHYFAYIKPFLSSLHLIGAGMRQGDQA